jgi:flagellin-like protein
VASERRLEQHSQAHRTESFLYHEVEVILAPGSAIAKSPGLRVRGRGQGKKLRRFDVVRAGFGARRKAVSPIIATILLVAITVVLAAVLYVMISGLSHNTAATPLGTAFFAGPASETVGSAQTNTYCQNHHFCYSIPIDEAGQGVTFGDLNFVVHTSTGSDHVVTQNFAQLSVVSDKNAVQAFSKIAKNSAFAVTAWQAFSPGTSSGTPLSDLQTIWIQFGNTHVSPFGQGETLEVIGTGTFSGSVVVDLP